MRTGSPHLRAHSLAALQPDASTGAPASSPIREADWSWMDRATCQDSVPGSHNPVFFSESPALTLEALAICDGCPVRAACRDFAIRTGQEFGVWGGLDEHALRRLTKAAHGGARVQRVGHRVTRPAASAPPARTHCKHGHPFDQANTHVRPDGSRQCRACARARVHRHLAAKKERSA